MQTGDFALEQEIDGNICKEKIHNCWTLFESNDFGEKCLCCTLLCFLFHENSVTCRKLRQKQVC